MLASHQNGAFKKFQRTPWRFQQTFQTPLRSLDMFTRAILDSLKEVHSGILVIDSVAMQPTKLEALLSDHQLPHDLRHDATIVAETAGELQPLLSAALGDWVNFLFIPSPKPFVLYADHDEYTTFFANTKSNLSTVTATLTARGFRTLENYTRNA